MCGLFGHSATKPFIEQTPTFQMVAMNAILATCMDKRGGDGWGHADFSLGWEQPIINKGLEFITPQITTTLTRKVFSRIGHTRKRTTGVTSLRNSHPFTAGNIVGAHNGIINNHLEIARELDITVEVDSEVIFHAIDKELDLSKISGYGAIVYYDLRKPGVTFLGRFNSGQLAIWGVGEDHDHPDMVVWASTKEAVETALIAAGLKGFPYSVDDNKLYYTQGGKLFTNNQPIPIEAFRSVVTKTQYSGDHDWAAYWESKYGEYRRDDIIDVTDTVKETEKKKESVFGVHGDPTLSQLWSRFNEGISTVDFPVFLAKAAGAGCEVCSVAEQWSWFDYETELFLCGDCALDLEIDFGEALCMRDLKRLSWSYNQQQVNKHLTAGWAK